MKRRIQMEILENVWKMNLFQNEYKPKWLIFSLEWLTIIGLNWIQYKLSTNWIQIILWVSFGLSKFMSIIQLVRKRNIQMNIQAFYEESSAYKSKIWINFDHVLILYFSERFSFVLKTRDSWHVNIVYIRIESLCLSSNKWK